MIVISGFYCTTCSKTIQTTICHYRSLKQKTSSCSLRIKARNSQNHVRLDEVFQASANHPVDDVTLPNEMSAFGSTDTLTTNQIAPFNDTTNQHTPQKPGRKPRAPFMKKALLPRSNQRTGFRLKRGFDHMVDHVMSPVLESTPIKGRPGAGGGISLAGMNMVDGINNVRHLAETMDSPSLDASVCSVM